MTVLIEHVPAGRAATWVAARLPPAINPPALLTAAFLILTAGVTGEAGALWALCDKHDDTPARLCVLIATIVLVLADVTLPLLAYISVTHLLQHYRDTASPGQRGAPEPAGPAGPSAEPGETGTD